MKDPLFQPIKLNQIEVSNRIYMPAMHLNMASDYKITPRLIEFYAERARGGAGMICVGYATVDENSGMPLCIGAHSDEFIPGLRLLAGEIKKWGAKSAVQLNHSGRYNFSFFLGGRDAVAPSAVYSRLTKETPREMTISEIKEVIGNFARAAKRVKEAGFDAVEILHGTGYLISSFLSPLTNKRNDEYGGSFENRIKFGLEVTRAVRETVGKDFPVIARINGNEFMEGGSNREDLQKYAIQLEENGVDAICVNVGWHESPVPQIIASVPEGAFGYLARGIKEKVHIPVIASHRINDPAVARKMISDGLCDMVAMGRSLITDPYLPQKAKNGEEDKIIHCIACAQACFDNVFKLKPIECVCNPVAGYEIERKIQKAKEKKRVLVAGGGPAGISAAIALSKRGHEVILCEKSVNLGGQFNLASIPPGREELRRFVEDFELELKRNGVKVYTETIVDEELIRKIELDFVIIATGSRPAKLEIEGHDLPHVINAKDALQGRVDIGKEVVIIGGGAVGLETALFVASSGTISAETVKFLLINGAEKAEDIVEFATKGTRKVTVVEMTAKAGKDIGRTTRWAIMQQLDKLGVKQRLATKAVQIKESAVVVEFGKKQEEIPADTVIIAAGAVPENGLEETCRKMNLPYIVVGDSRKPATLYEAVHQGYLAGMGV